MVNQIWAEMERLEVGRWVIHCDAEATRHAYRTVPYGAPEDCGCDDCRNFAAVRHLIYTPEMVALLDQLGIDQRKEAEIYYGGPGGDGRHAYGGWFHFVGAIESGEDAWSPDGRLQPEPSGNSCEIGFSRHLNLVPASFGAQPLVQVEFWAKVPWVVELPEPK